MDIYAEQLERCLDVNHDVERVTPSSKLERLSDSAWTMRYLRYVDYPRRVGRVRADVHLVVDHGYAHLQPKFGSGKSCVLVHDLIPMLTYLGEIKTENQSSRPRLNEHSLSYLTQYDQVVVPSQCTANDLIRQLNIPFQDISVIPPCVDDGFTVLESSSRMDFASRYKLDSNARWVMISGQEFYKNHEASLLAVKKMIDSGTNVRILKTGITTKHFRGMVRELGLEGQVSSVFLNDPCEMPAVYNFVDCLLFPSLYEGFGMPVVEALACGTPVVTSSAGALLDTGGKYVARCSTEDIDCLAESALEFLGDSTTREERVRRAEPELRKYRRKQVSQKWQNLLRELIA